MNSDTTCSLRPAVPADWPVIAALLESQSLPTAGAQAHLHGFLVAVLEGEVVAVAGAEVRGDVALLRSVAVKSDLHGRGIGRQVVERLLHEARRRDIATLYLLTETAAEYFARFGFARTARAQAPQALRASAEFNGACPDSATLMSLVLRAPRTMPDTLPVAVIGAGPVGLAAVARLIERGITPLVFEAGAQVGANLLDYAHVRLFSPWRYNVDESTTSLLSAQGWQAPPAEQLPLAGEVVEQALAAFACLPEVAAALHLNSRVLAITREGFDKVKSVGRDGAPFVIRVLSGGVVSEHRARAVIDASGTWTSPNPLGANGLPAVAEREHGAAIFYGIPDVLGAARQRYAGKRSLVVGAGHSAANALLALAELARIVPGTRLAWAVRGESPARVFGGGAADELPARGQLGASLQALRDSGQLEFLSGFHITAIAQDEGALRVSGHDSQGQALHLGGIDEIICATGQRPDLTMTSELRLALDPVLEASAALGPLVDPNLHSCGSVPPHGHRELSHPERGFYTVGVKSYGRAPTFLMMTGFEQVRSVVAAIAGDLEAADRVALVLPQTGVCSVSDDVALAGSGACCAPAAPIVIAQSAALSCCAAPAKEHTVVNIATARCCDPKVGRQVAKATGCCEPAIAGQADKGCC